MAGFVALVFFLLALAIILISVIWMAKPEKLERKKTGLYVTNIGATVAYVKLYNKSAAPKAGIDTPVMIIPVPAAVDGVPGVAEIAPDIRGHRFPLGLSLVITDGEADDDTTSIAAGQVNIHIS